MSRPPAFLAIREYSLSSIHHNFPLNSGSIYLVTSKMRCKLFFCCILLLMVASGILVKNPVKHLW